MKITSIKGCEQSRQLPSFTVNWIYYTVIEIFQKRLDIIVAIYHGDRRLKCSHELRRNSSQLCALVENPKTDQNCWSTYLAPDCPAVLSEDCVVSCQGNALVSFLLTRYCWEVCRGRQKTLIHFFLDHGTLCHSSFLLRSYLFPSLIKHNRRKIAVKRIWYSRNVHVTKSTWKKQTETRRRECCKQWTSCRNPLVDCPQRHANGSLSHSHSRSRSNNCIRHSPKPILRKIGKSNLN